jgi:hypothetical protein
MYCSKCGTEMPLQSSFCSNCGTQVNSTSPTSQYQFQATPGSLSQPPRTAGLAIAAFVVALFFAPLGLIMGYLARREIRASGGNLGGSGLATTAIVLGWISVAFIFFLFVLAITIAATSPGYI